VTSLVLKPTGNVPMPRAAPTGKRQKKLLAELERRTRDPSCARLWTEGELREIARSLGMHKNSARDAVLGLRQLGYLVASVGGSYLTHLPPFGINGTERPNRTESTISVPVRGPKTGTKAQASLDAVPFGPAVGPGPDAP